MENTKHHRLTSFAETASEAPLQEPDRQYYFIEKAKESNNKIDNELYSKFDVKKGLRNEDGTGVLVGLTKIADVVGYKKIDGKKVDCDGELYYRGIAVSDIINKREPHQRFLFEETCFLILFGYLPNKEELENFKKELSERYELFGI